MQIISKRHVIAAGALIVSGVAACTPIRNRHGYSTPTVEGFDAVVVGEYDRDRVLDEFGTPSVYGAFHDDEWYYISSIQESWAFFKPKTSQRRIVAIAFAPDGTVTNVRELDLEDGHKVAFVDRETPTKGRELSFLEQLFGSVGRLPVPGEQGPGGPGGPGI